LDINVRRRAQVPVIQLRGALRMGQAVDGFRDAVQECLNGGDTNLVINLEEVPMIDSSGVGALVKSMTSVKQLGGTVKLVNPSKFAVQTLRLVGVLNLFEIFEDENQAVESFRPAS
jgi:anti-sigma B factor antagonist